MKTYFWILNKMQHPKQKDDQGISQPDIPASVMRDVDTLAGFAGKGLDCSLQVGDMGIFNEKESEQLIVMDQHKFIRGNHDNPSLCKIHPNHLGDYGYEPSMDMFWLAGGFSIDHRTRMTGVDWWPDEQLSYKEMQSALDLYAQSKPKIMVSHECPSVVIDSVLPRRTNAYHSSKTEVVLQQMYEIHQPDIWIFGHYHMRKDIQKGKTLFIVLNEMINGPIKECIFEINGLNWPKQDENL